MIARTSLHNIIKKIYYLCLQLDYINYFNIFLLVDVVEVTSPPGSTIGERAADGTDLSTQTRPPVVKV